MASASLRIDRGDVITIANVDGVGHWLRFGPIGQPATSNIWAHGPAEADALGDAARELAARMRGDGSEQPEDRTRTSRLLEAAPAMLAALEELLAISSTDDWNASGRLNDALDDAREAVAVARGSVEVEAS